MIKREVSEKLLEAEGEYPVLILTGARQTGKTTLVKHLFPDYTYVTLEDPDLRTFALQDGRGFLSRYKNKVILDEVQRVPELFSYIQGIVDQEQDPGRFVMTGSQNFLLLDKLSQTLAGRAAIFRLSPFSFSELAGRPGLPLDLKNSKEQKSDLKENLYELLYKGFYPRIHDKNLNPQTWLMNYYNTYIERDVRSLTNVGDLDLFTKFVGLCAGRTGQLLDLTSLGNDCGISGPTARRWLTILEASFLIKLLQPFHKNFNKRLIKSPKLYFLDTGLLIYLLRIKKPEDLITSPFKGAIFETFIFSEFYKKYLNKNLQPELYFFRDSAGHEIDFIITSGSDYFPLEIKAGETFSPSFIKGLEYWNELTGTEKGYLVYGGDSSFTFKNQEIFSWKEL